MEQKNVLESEYAFYGDSLYEVATGRLISKEEITKANDKRLIELYEMYCKEASSLGVEIDWKLFKYRGNTYPVIKIAPKNLFMKVFRVAVRDLMENGNLSKNAKSFIACMQPYIYFPCNYIVYKCGNPNTEELTKMFDMGRSTLFDTLKELEEKEVVKRIKRGGQMIIYVNPFLYSAGGLVERDTYELFKDSIYAR